jgi:hypothetical protein
MRKLFWLALALMLIPGMSVEANIVGEPALETLVEFKGVVVGIDRAYCYKEKPDYYCTEYIFKALDMIHGDTSNEFIIAYGLGGETPSGFPGAMYSNDPYLSVGDRVWVSISSVFPEVGLSISGRYMLGQMWNIEGEPWRASTRAVEVITARHGKAIDARRKELGKTEEDLSCRPNKKGLIRVTEKQIENEGLMLPPGVVLPEEQQMKWTGEVSPNPPMPLFTPWKFKPYGIQQLYCIYTGWHGEFSCGWPYKWHTKKVKMYWNPIHLTIDGYSNSIFPSSRDARMEYFANLTMQRVGSAHGKDLYKNMGRTSVMSDMLTKNGVGTIAYFPWGTGFISGSTTFKNYNDPLRCAAREVDIGINPMYQYVTSCGDQSGYDLYSVILHELMRGLGIGRFPGSMILYPYLWKGECNRDFTCMDRWALWEVGDNFDLKCNGTGHRDINWWSCWGW